MLAYHVSQSNEYTFRTEPTSSNSFTMSLQDMYTLENLTSSMSNITYDGYESILAFTASITGAIVAGEYRAVVYNDANPIWHGTIQVYPSQSLDKSVYENQNTQYISHVTENRYVILD